MKAAKGISPFNHCIQLVYIYIPTGFRFLEFTLSDVAGERSIKELFLCNKSCPMPSETRSQPAEKTQISGLSKSVTQASELLYMITMPHLPLARQPRRDMKFGSGEMENFTIK